MAAFDLRAIVSRPSAIGQVLPKGRQFWMRKQQAKVLRERSPKEDSRKVTKNGCDSSKSEVINSE
jgi:hypothetical protein